VTVILEHLDSLDAKRIADALSFKEDAEGCREEWMRELREIFVRLSNVKRPRSYGVVRIKLEEAQ